MVPGSPPDGRGELGVFVGLTTLDVIHRSGQHAGENEKITATWQGYAAGGPAANAAVVFAALGGRARLITTIGNGPIAPIIRADLSAHGVQIIDLEPDSPTDPAISSVLVNYSSGDRSVVSMDATAHDTAAPAGIAEMLSGAGVILLDGHHPKVSLAAAAMAAELGIPVVLDAGRWKPVMADLLPFVTAVISSEVFRTPGAADTLETSRALLAQGLQKVATTRGPHGIRWWEPHESGDIAVPHVVAVDTLGAGDFFHGAFCRYLAAGVPGFPAQLAAASRIAAFRCTRVGPRDWLRELDSTNLPGIPINHQEPM